jgi:hypothetical protein
MNLMSIFLLLMSSLKDLCFNYKPLKNQDYVKRIVCEGIQGKSTRYCS